MSKIDAVKALANELYDVETRPAKVADALTKVGFVAALSKVGVVNGKADKVLETVASMTTVAGLLEKKDAALEIAAPYIEKAKVPEGRKEIYDEVVATELVQSGMAKINEKVVEPVIAKKEAVKEYAAPYVASAKEYTDPYVAKLQELRNSERVATMIEAFQQAREHPAEKVGELKSKAVDLIKYETIVEYRDHVMSSEFQENTIQLVKDLPALAESAAKNGMETVKEKAMLATEAAVAYSEKLKALVPTEEELMSAAEKVKETGASLLVELHAEYVSGVEHVKTEGFSYDDTIERLKRVVALVDKMVVAPVIMKVKDTATGGVAEDDEMHDAVEEPETGA